LTVLFVFLVMLIPDIVDDLAASPNRYTVRAYIGPRCEKHNSRFTIPTGRQAVALRFTNFSAGTSCKTGSTIRDRYFSIFKWNGRDWDRVFRVVHRSGQQPVHYPIHINDTRLGPGSYQLSVAGGNGAQVNLSYQLTP
jgi:hypothetical protein